MSARDTIYLNEDKVTSFVFDERVASVFADMINRSVPGYGTIVSMIGTMAERYARPGSVCYDLGCSLGAASFAMRQQVQAADCRIVAVDNSQAMLDRFAQVLAQDSGGIPVELRCGDILDELIDNASVVVLNFTLQFIAPDKRAALIDKIYQGMRPGGLLILSEKIHFEDDSLNQLFIDLHHRFKEQNGYSAMEISRKRQAIENVLVPETLKAHEQRLMQSGFSSFSVWFQCFNFASMVAVK